MKCFGSHVNQHFWLRTEKVLSVNALDATKVGAGTEPHRFKSVKCESDIAALFEKNHTYSPQIVHFTYMHT